MALLSAPVVACGSSTPPPEVDELFAQIERARNDSRLATDAAAAARGEIVEALTAVATERAAHAKALSDELVRIHADAQTTSPSQPTTTTADAAKAPTVQDVIGALKTSAQSATGLAATSSGYRAGLLGSIAAACTAAYTVALVPPEKPQ